jgi:CcmD family protein
MNKITRLFIAIALSCASFFVQAQATSVEPSDLMHSNGKIHVVVAVLVTILLGMFFYLINLDRKISKMEKM